MAFFHTNSFHIRPNVGPIGGRLIYDPYNSSQLKNLRNWEQVQRCARPGYNLISCFAEIRDLREPYYGHYISRLPVNGYGIPLSAKRTVLASRLRRGYYTADGVWHRFKDDARCQFPIPLHRKEPTINRVKEIERLKGRLIGVEIEYYPSVREYMPETLQDGPLCRIGTDGSIGSGGREIRKLTWADPSGRLAGVLALPIDGTTDERCGLHVHVDCRHIAGNIVQTYERVLQFFPHLKRLVPRNRLNNKFCHWENNCVMSPGFTRDSRYCAVNFYAWDEHRTLEFRMQGGMVNPVAIESWALLCQYIVNWAAILTNPVPALWKDFVAILPEPLRSWAILRDRAIKNFLRIDARVLSAIY